MNNIRLNKFKTPTLAVALAFCAAGLVPHTFAQDAPPQQAPAPSGARTDGQIEMDVVQALDASAALKNDLITAATIQGQVTLSGTVATDSDKQLAESIAAKVPGVSGVKNNLNIGDPANDPNAQGAPADDSSAPVADDQGQQANPAPPPAYAPDQGAPQQPQQPAYGQQQPYPQQGQPPYPQQGQQPYPQQGQQPGYPPPPPGYGRQPYAPQPYATRPAPSYPVATGPITILQGTVLQLRTNETLESKHAKNGQPVDFTVIRDVLVQGYLAIPRGATAHGVITEVKHSGELTGAPELALRLTSLDMGGKSYPLDSDEFKVKGPSKTGRTVSNAIGGALLGAIIGGGVGGGGGAAVGAVAGGGIGTAASAPGSPRAWIPAEALVTFHLNSPVTVDPVSHDEAMRLAQGLYPGGPQLYRRGYYGPAYYGYPAVYYRPYYMVGGYYYWR